MVRMFLNDLYCAMCSFTRCSFVWIIICFLKVEPLFLNNVSRHSSWSYVFLVTNTILFYCLRTTRGQRKKVSFYKHNQGLRQFLPAEGWVIGWFRSKIIKKGNFCFLVHCSFIICLALDSNLTCKFSLQFLLAIFTCNFYLQILLANLLANFCFSRFWKKSEFFENI